MILPQFLACRQSRAQLFWLALSLSVAAAYSVFALQEAFSSEWVVQDDARQHVFWMLRFTNSELFPDDFIANYFQTVAPAGYQWLYRGAIALGFDPFVFNKLLPVGLNLIAAGYCFGTCLQIFPVPAAAFTATLLLSQSLGLTDAVVSGTPKAFIYPLFLAFLYYLLRRSLWPCLGAIALLGLFYPQMVLLAAAILTLRLVWRSHRQDWVMSVAGLAVAFLVLLPYALKTHQFEPVISVAQARSLPEFLPGGRSRFFYDNDPAKFWLRGRGGVRLPSILTPVTNATGFLLLVLPQFPQRFPIVRQLQAKILLQIVVASVGMFFAAHALLFRLHLPSRYTEHSLRMVMSIASGIVLVILIESLWRWAKPGGRALLAGCATIVMAIALAGYPRFVEKFPVTAYRVGEAPALYEFFQQQPPDSLIASLTDEGNNLPTFARRSILVGSEYAIPYHWGYYRPFRERVLNLMAAQYSPNLQVVRDVIQKYGIDFWLLKPSDFTPEALADDPWLMQYQPAANEAISHLQSGVPAILKTIPHCTVFQSKDLVVLDANCIRTAN
ncbi:MAG: hypothetical protein ACFB4I_07465 [Cyanophyceae cyanobacterium]